ncbi:MAG: ribosome-associated translation inhibitor RaiA [Verrucomicrobiota bacterium]
MQIAVTGRHMDLSEEVKNYALEKVEHALRDFPRVLHVHVILDVQKHRQKAEIVVQAKNHINLEADDESDNMYASIDAAVDRTAKQLRKLRDKVQHHKSQERIAEIDLAQVAARDNDADEF